MEPELKSGTFLLYKFKITSPNSPVHNILQITSKDIFF